MELVVMPRVFKSCLLACCLLSAISMVEAKAVACINDRTEFMKSDAACRVLNQEPRTSSGRADSGKAKSAVEFPYRTAIYAEAGGPAKAFSLNVEDTRLLGWPVRMGVAYYAEKYSDPRNDYRYQTLLGIVSASIFGRHTGRNVDLQIGMVMPLWTDRVISADRTGLFSPYVELSTIFEPKGSGIYIKLSATFAPLAEWPDMKDDYGKFLAGIAIGYTL